MTAAASQSGSPSLDPGSGSKPAGGYLPQLDGLRALAVGMVLVQHFVPPDKRLGMDFGTPGVWLFFVLSGFLITGILLRSRAWVDGGLQSAGYTWRQFYIRRSLRIFPLFYVWTLLVAVAGWFDFQGALPAHLTYTTNLVASWRGETIGGSSAHYWSLAVEEQFYLVWPFLLLLLPVRWLGGLIAGCVVLGCLTRLGMSLSGVGWVACKQFIVPCLEPLALGGLVAWAGHRSAEAGGLAAASLLRWRQALLLVGAVVLGLGVAIYLDAGRAHWYSRSLFMTGCSLVAAWLIWRGALGFNGWLGRLLCLGPLVYVGRISYGVYVVHPFVGKWVQDQVAFPSESLVWQVAGLGLKVLGSVALAALFWHVLEYPLNRMKRHFPMRRPEAKEASNA